MTQQYESRLIHVWQGAAARKQFCKKLQQVLFLTLTQKGNIFSFLFHYFSNISAHLSSHTNTLMPADDHAARIWLLKNCSVPLSSSWLRAGIAFTLLSVPSSSGSLLKTLLYLLLLSLPCMAGQGDWNAKEPWMMDGQYGTNITPTGTWKSGPLMPLAELGRGKGRGKKKKEK